MTFDFEKEVGYYMEREIDSWFNEEYMKIIANEIVTLLDYVPKDIELKLPDYEARNEFLEQNHEFTSSDY